MHANPAPPASADVLDAPLLPSRDAARMLAVSERTLFTLTKTGRLPAVRLLGAVRYDPADLRRFVETSKTAARPEPVGAGRGAA